MKTEFTKSNDEFSTKGFQFAQEKILPDFFDEFYPLHDELEFHDTHLTTDSTEDPEGKNFLDGEACIDAVIGYGGGRFPTTWAYRFRKMDLLEKYGDQFTITFENPSGVPTEWQKLGFVQYYLYGFHDDEMIRRFMILDAKLLSIKKDRLVWIDPPANFKGQKFKAIHIQHLIDNDIVLMYKNYPTYDALYHHTLCYRCPDVSVCINNFFPIGEEYGFPVCDRMVG